MPIAATRLLPSGDSQTLRQADVRPSTWDEADRSVDVVWTTGAAVTRFDWYDGAYYDETLSIDAGAVRIERLQAGGPVLVDHIGSTRTLAGSIVPGSVRFERGEGVARIRLADTDDMKDTVAKVRDGHLRTVSVGYSVHKYERTEGQPGARDQMHATDWEPFEISLTPVPADAGAIIRTRSKDVPEIIENETEHRPEPRAKGRTVTADHIRRVCAQGDYSRKFERELLEEHEDRPFTTGSLERKMNDEYAARNRVPMIDNAITMGDGAGLRSAFADALYARLSGKQVSAQGAPYAGASLMDMGRALLEERGTPARWMRPSAA